MNRKIYTVLTSIFAILFLNNPLSSQTPTANIATWKDNKKAAYTIIHDDFSDYVTGITKHADPIATARGIKLSFGAITNFCSAAQWEAGRTMQSHGHECINHTHNHFCGGTASQCTGQTTYAPADFATELKLSTQIIEREMKVRPRFFIHPYDASSPEIVKYLQDTLGYIGARAGTQEQLNQNSFSDFMNLNYFVFRGTAADILSLNSSVNDAITAGGYVMREFHGIDDPSFGAMTVANYTSHLDYVKTKMDDGSIWSATPTEAITYKMQRDAFQPVVVYTASTNSIAVNFTSTKTIDPSVLTTSVTVNVDLNGISGNYEVAQNGKVVAATRNGNVITFNVYPHLGNVVLTCKNCPVEPTTPADLACLKASYFNNSNLSGTPFSVRYETKIDNNWGLNAPLSGVNADYFSVRWDGTIIAPVSGTYVFSVTADDGVRFYLNNQLLINKWFQQYATTYTVSVILTKGQSYNLKMEYYEREYDAVAKLAWKTPNQAQQVMQFSSTCNATPPVVAGFDATKCYKLEARHSQLVLDVEGSSLNNNANIIQNKSANNDRSQTWRIKAIDNTFYQLVNTNSGKVLGVQSASTADAAQIQQQNYTQNSSQMWKFERNTEGYFYLRAKHSNKVLDIYNDETKKGAKAIQWPINYGTNQQWKVAEVGCPAYSYALQSTRSANFEGRANSNTVTLQWVVQSAITDDYFELERSAENGDFKSLTIVKADPKNAIQSFTFADVKPWAGDNFYRLKTTTADGTIILSDIVKVNFQPMEAFKIFPNPATDEFAINLSIAEGKAVDITIATALGKVVKVEKIESATVSHTMNLDGLSDGQYFIRIETKGQRSVMKKLVILR